MKSTAKTKLEPQNSSVETPVKKAIEPSTPSSEPMSENTQNLRSKLAALGFKPEQEETGGFTGIGIIGGVHKPAP